MVFQETSDNWIKRTMLLRYFLNCQKDTTRTNSTTLLTDVITLLRSGANN